MRQLYKPKIVSNFDTCIYGEFLPKNTIYMRTQTSYIWCAAYDLAHMGKPVKVYTLSLNDKSPKEHYFVKVKTSKINISSNKVAVSPLNHDVCIMWEYVRAMVKNGAVIDKPILCINKRDLHGLAPKNTLVSKAYSTCKLYTK